MKCPDCGCWHTRCIAGNAWAWCRKPERQGPHDHSELRCKNERCNCHVSHSEWHQEHLPDRAVAS